MKPTNAIRKHLQERFGKGGYKLVWNHGGYSLYVKRGGTFIHEAYDAESWCKKEFNEERFYK